MIIPIRPYLSQILSGTFITVTLVVCALLVGLLLATILTFFSLSKKPWLNGPVKVYLFVIRGTPLLVQFFIIYFGSSQFVWLRESIFWPLFAKPFSCAVIALAINTSAYTTVLLCGAVRSIPYGEIEACKALGMSRLAMMRWIVLPRAIRIALPAYSNEVILVLKGSSLASTITLLDLMGVTQNIIANTYASIEFLLIAGAIYFALNLLIISGFRVAERKLRIMY